jgi:hypothetical protein
MGETFENFQTMKNEKPLWQSTLWMCRAANSVFGLERFNRALPVKREAPLKIPGA